MLSSNLMASKVAKFLDPVGKNSSTLQPTISKLLLKLTNRSLSLGLCHRFGHLRPPMYSSPGLLSSKTLFHKVYGFLGTKLA